jgi:hypothetical protein
MRVSTSLWVVLREASKPQCSVASSCARTDGEIPAGAPGRAFALGGHGAILSHRGQQREERGEKG